MQKIGVLSPKQHPNDSPRRYVKKSVAALLCRRLLCEWIIENVLIRELVVKAIAPSDADRFLLPALSIVMDPEDRRTTPKREFWAEALLVRYPLPNLETTVRVLQLARTTAS